MKRNISILLIIMSILIVFSTLVFASGTIDVKDYIKGKLPSIFNFYLSSLEELDLYEKEFIDLLEKLPEEEQEYYAKEVYKNGFSLELLEKLKKGETFEDPTLDRNKIKEKYEATKEKDEEPVVKTEEKPIESLPSLIKRIKPSTVIVFTYKTILDYVLKKEKETDNILRLGSGFFINQSGDIITNYHVLQGAGSAEVKTSDGKTYPITHIVAVDKQNDIICLSVDIPSKYIHPLSLNTALPEVGEKIIVYGSPLGLEKTVSDGIVSAIREIPGYGKLIQITAPISPGSSGSPVLNMKGEVIGIATFQFIEGQNLNFAIPSERIANLDLTEEKETSVGEELFEQEEKEKKDSDYAYEAYNKALYFIDKREYEKALLYLEIAIKTDISSLKAWAYFKIGFCYGKLKFYAKAIEAFKQAVRINPDDAKAHYGLGVTYHLIGDDNSALKEYKILKELDIDLANKLFDMIYE